MDLQTLLLPQNLPIIVAGLMGFYMAWAIGANDVANAMGTSVGAGALTVKQAIVVAAIFEFAGAFLVGGNVTSTIRKGILDVNAFSGQPDVLICGMLGSLAAAATWLIIASRMGWPVSTTHSIVGAIVGFGAAVLGIDAVAWGKVGTIGLSWLTSPLLGGIFAFWIFRTTQITILDHDQPMERAKKAGPYYIFVVLFTICLVTLFKGLKNLHLDFSLGEAFVLSVLISGVGAVIGHFSLARIPVDKDADRAFHYASVEKIFASLQVMTACAVAFAHGSNDVANAIGPLAAVVATVREGTVNAEAGIPLWMLGLGGLGIVVGLATYGYKVMETVGKKITELTPSRAFSATLGATITIVVASKMGIPVSTTHVLVGGVLGVGLARGIGALDGRVVGTIALSWVATLPTGAALSVAFYYLFQWLLY
jgi:PiT family inorganic phosphate transporter